METVSKFKRKRRGGGGGKSSLNVFREGFSKSREKKTKKVQRYKWKNGHAPGTFCCLTCHASRRSLWMNECLILPIYSSHALNYRLFILSFTSRLWIYIQIMFFQNPTLLLCFLYFFN
jgi:hypothetical protein